MTQAELSDKLEVKRTTIGGYESGTSTPDVATLIRIAEFFGVSLDELMFADLEAVYATAASISEAHKAVANTTQALAEGYKTLGETTKVLGQINEPNVNLNVNPNVNPSAKIGSEMSMVREDDALIYGSKTRAIPILDARAAAGWPYALDNSVFLHNQLALTLPSEWFQPGEIVLMQIDGDSMHPTIYHHDWVFIRRLESQKDIKDGIVHVVLTRDGIVCKRLINRASKGIALQSDNTTYPTYVEPGDNVISIWKVEMKMSAILRNENMDIVKRISTLEVEFAEFRAGKKKV